MNISLVLKNRKYYRKRINFIRSSLELSNCSLLDLGAGELLLRNELKSVNYKSYIGVDSIQFQIDSEFIYSDIFDFLNENSLTYDCVFCLGVLDHLNEDDRKRLLNKLGTLFNKYLIFSISNHDNLLLRIFKNKLKLPLINGELEELYLLKLPFTQELYKLNRDSLISKLIATEIIYIFNNRS